MIHADLRFRSLFRPSAIRFLALAALLLFGRGMFATPQQSSSPANGPLIYVPGTAGGTTEINATNNVVFATAPWRHGSNGGIAIATNTVIKTISVGAGANPIWVTISPDGSRAYISNQSGGTISVIDTASNTILTNFPIGSLPFHSAFSRDGRFLWVSVQGEGVVKLVDPNTNTIVSSIPAGPVPRGIAFTPDGSRAYENGHRG